VADGEALGRPVRRNGRGGHVRPFVAAATMPTRTPEPLVRKIVHLRWKQRLSPIEIGAKLNMPASTVHAVLVRC
jgi:hypothetical protein